VTNHAEIPAEVDAPPTSAPTSSRSEVHYTSPSSQTPLQLPTRPYGRARLPCGCRNRGGRLLASSGAACQRFLLDLSSCRHPSSAHRIARSSPSAPSPPAAPAPSQRTAFPHESGGGKRAEGATAERRCRSEGSQCRRSRLMRRRRWERGSGERRSEREVQEVGGERTWV
jgi:hypothetical protein